MQRTRYLLQARVRRAKTCPRNLFAAACAQLLAWVRGHPLLGVIAHELSSLPGEHKSVLETADRYLADRGGRLVLTSYHAQSIEEHAAFSLGVIERVASAAKHADDLSIIRTMAYIASGQNAKLDDQVELIRDIAVDGLYEFLDERVDARNAMLGLLLKYKQRCEWFHHERLRALATEGVERRRPGEESLAVDLQEYVFDQGVEFSIEPSSVSGEADLILRDTDGSHIVLDAKYIPRGATASDYRKKVGRGFHQVARYCADYNEQVGYLVVFIDDVRVPRIASDTSDGFSYVTLHGRQIYFVTISIAHRPTASVAGKAEEVVIDPADIIVVPD